MASRLAEIYRSEKSTGGGLSSAVGKRLKEKIDPRQMLDQSGLLVSMFPSLKSFNATRGKGVAEKVSSNVGGGIDNSVLNTLAATSSLTAKNTMSLPMMARDMNLMKLNIFKLVKLQGGSANTNKTDIFFKNAKDRETAYENTIGKIAGSKIGGILGVKQRRDGQSSSKALFVTGGTEGEDKESLIEGALKALASGALLTKMATLASAVVSSPLFLGAAALGTIVLAKKLRDDEIASDPEKYKNVPSERAKKEGITVGQAGEKNRQEALKSKETITKGIANDIVKRLTADKMIGAVAESFIKEISSQADLEYVLGVCDGTLKDAYLKMVAANTPKPTPLSISPAGAGRGLVNPENAIEGPSAGGGRGFVNPTLVTPEAETVPSNVIRSGSGAPIMTGSGGYVTSGEATPMRPSPAAAAATTSQTTSPIKQSTATIGDAPDLPIDYKSYATKIGEKESGGKYDAVNTIGYLGKYQFGSMALEDMGLVKKGVGKKGQKALNDPENWTIPGGKEAFLSNAALQEDAMKRLTMQNFKTLNRMGIINKDTSPEKIAGYLASSHLLGPGGALALSKGTSGSDAYGTSAASYYKVGASTQIASTTTASVSTSPSSSLGKSSSTPSVSPSSPSTGTSVASASASVADGKMAAMAPSGGNTVINNNPTNVASGSSSSGGKTASPYDSELFQTLVGYQSMSA